MIVAVEGCIGAGKTTVTTGLAAKRRSSSLLEDFGSNPFLRAFYADPVGNALETEFAFLLLHFHQLKSVAGRNEEVVADFHLGKDLIYAGLNLKDPSGLHLFDSAYQLLSERVSAPDVMVFLSGPTELFIDRIRRRNRDFEQTIDRGYYALVNSAYESFYEHYSGKKLRVPMNDWDFVQDPSLFDDLSALIDRELGRDISGRPQ